MMERVEEAEEVEEKEVVEEEWKEVEVEEKEEEEVERGNMKGSLEMPELVSRLRTSVVVVERAIGEPLRMMLRKVTKLPTIHLLRRRQSKEKLLLLKAKLRTKHLLRTRSLWRRR